MSSAAPPPLVHYATEADYRAHYTRVYCNAGSPIQTHDGYRVYFPRYQFDHAFHRTDRSTLQKTTVLALDRAERIDWIRWVLQNPGLDTYRGWDNQKKRPRGDRRVIVYGNYVCIIQKDRKGRVMFVTAYVADAVALRLVRGNPKAAW